MTADIRITDADRNRVPKEAVCQRCGSWWVRPPEDPTAATLAFFGFFHADCPPDAKRAASGTSWPHRRGPKEETE